MKDLLRHIERARVGANLLVSLVFLGGPE